MAKKVKKKASTTTTKSKHTPKAKATSRAKIAPKTSRKPVAKKTASTTTKRTPKALAKKTRTASKAKTTSTKKATKPKKIVKSSKPVDKKKPINAKKPTPGKTAAPKISLSSTTKTQKSPVPSGPSSLKTTQAPASKTQKTQEVIHNVNVTVKNPSPQTIKPLPTPTAGRIHASSKTAPYTIETLISVTAIPDEEYMNEENKARFRQILLAWKKQLLNEMERTVHHMQDDAASFADPNDRATQEEEFSLELRTRDRELKLIKKIEEALQRIDNNEYGYCEACGVQIGLQRLEARPTATLCIDCKTVDEIREKHYS